MNDVKAHELVDEDAGVDIVVRSSGVITYVGWLAGARNVDDQWTVLALDDFAGRLKITVLMRREDVVHVTPFSPLAPGDLVAHITRGHVGTVMSVAFDSKKRRVYRVQWNDVPEPAYYLRRSIRHVDAESVAAS